MRNRPERLREIIRFGIAEETNQDVENGLRVKRRNYSLQASALGLMLLPILAGGLVLMGSNGLAGIIAIVKKMI